MSVSLPMVIPLSQRGGGGRPGLQMLSSGPDLPQDRLVLSWAAWSGEGQTGDSISLAANKNYTWVLDALQHTLHPSTRLHLSHVAGEWKKTWIMYYLYKCFFCHYLHPSKGVRSQIWLFGCSLKISALPSMISWTGYIHFLPLHWYSIYSTLEK